MLLNRMPGSSFHERNSQHALFPANNLVSILAAEGISIIFERVGPLKYTVLSGSSSSSSEISAHCLQGKPVITSSDIYRHPAVNKVIAWVPMLLSLCIQVLEVQCF